MGFEAFRLLWEKRDLYNIVLLLRPSRSNKRRFSAYEKQSWITPVGGTCTLLGKGLKIVWGDALNQADVVEACGDIDWYLECISPPWNYEEIVKKNRFAGQVLDPGDLADVSY